MFKSLPVVSIAGSMRPPAPRGVGPRPAPWHDNPDVLYLLAVVSLIVLGIAIIAFY